MEISADAETGLSLSDLSLGSAGDGSVPSSFEAAEAAYLANGDFEVRRNVFDPTGGANYTGGSDWVPGMSLAPSSAGLAGGVDPGDSDEAAEALYNVPHMPSMFAGITQTDVLVAPMGSGLAGPDGSSEGLRKVLEASQKPGTRQAAEIAQKLLKQSVELGEKTGERAQAMETARSQYRSLLRKVANLDSQVQLLTDRVFDEDGEVREDASPALVQRLIKLRKQAYKLGREAVRWQKTNVLATALTKNGYAQAELLQQMAITLMSASPKTTAVLAAQFENIGRDSSAIRDLRTIQEGKWVKKRMGLQGLEPFAGLEGIDYWEAELSGLEFAEIAYLEGIGSFLKRASRSVSRAAKSVSRSVKRTARKASRSVKRTVRKASRSVKRATRGATRFASRRMKSAIKRISRAAQKVGSRAARVAAKAARKVAKTASPIIKTARRMSKPVARSLKSAWRAHKAVGRGIWKGTGRLARGKFGSAMRAVSRSVKNTAKHVAAAGAAASIGFQCAFEKSPLGKATAQAVGTAVGSFYGGPMGGAAGNEAGRRANQVSRGVCDGMKRIGLTRGTIRPKQIGPAFRQTAKRIYKRTLQPKELLKSAVNIGMNYATGGGGGGIDIGAARQLINKAGQFSSQQAVNLAKRELRKKVSSDNMLRLAKKHGRKYLEKELQRNIRRNPTLRKLSSQVPAINAVYNMTGAFQGGRVNMNQLKAQIEKQAVPYLQKEAQRRASQYISQAPGQVARRVFGRQNVRQARRAYAAAQRARRMGQRAQRAYQQFPRNLPATTGWT